MTTFFDTSLLMGVGRLFSLMRGRQAKAKDRHAAGLLDVRELSDHLKRDMGFIDGNGFPHRRR